MPIAENIDPDDVAGSEDASNRGAGYLDPQNRKWQYRCHYTARNRAAGVAGSDKSRTDVAKPDGRLLRGEKSRRKIVDSLLALVGEGDMRPSAEAVAFRAKIGLRTVFRHFNDMESLYREMSDIMEEKLRPQYSLPYVSPDWRVQLGELATRVASIYEQVMPYMIAGEIRRFDSTEVLKDYRRMVVKHRRSVEGILGRADASTMQYSGALQVATSFDAWRKLRQDLGLSATASKATLLAMVSALIKAAGTEAVDTPARNPHDR